MTNDKISFESCTSFNPPPKRSKKEQLKLLAPSRFTIHPQQTPSFPFPLSSSDFPYCLVHSSFNSKSVYNYLNLPLFIITKKLFSPSSSSHRP